ncbi:hypothetical protein JCM1840_002469 [Sporobolomyces johnsonii]
MTYDIDEDKLKAEWWHLQETELDYAGIASEWHRRRAEGRIRRVDAAFWVLSCEIERALYLLELLGVDLRHQETGEGDQIRAEVRERAKALTAATNAEEIKAIRKTNIDRYEETVAALAPAFAAALAALASVPP